MLATIWDSNVSNITLADIPLSVAVRGAINPNPDITQSSAIAKSILSTSKNPI